MQNYKKFLSPAKKIPTSPKKICAGIGEKCTPKVQHKTFGVHFKKPLEGESLPAIYFDGR